MERTLSRRRALRIASLPLIAAAVCLAAPSMATAATHPNGIQGTGHAIHVNGIGGGSTVHVNGIGGGDSAVSPDGISGGGK